MSHRLDPLLRPKSIAVVGASERAGSVGRRIVNNLRAGGYQGALYPVNPGRESVLGLPCYPDLASLPGPAEHVAFAVSDQRIEAALRAAIEHGAKAATIMSQLILADDIEPRLQLRIEALIAESGLLVCGANGMGFYNGHDGVWMCGFDTRENHVRGGNVTLISHSGSGMSGIVDCEERLDFNLAVSTGQEINVGMADYMDFAMEVHQPRAIGLFMETVRDPRAMIEALQKARRLGIPVIALKVGRTALAAKLTQSHSGAMAGVDAAFEALFDRYGVQRVTDMDALATALILCAQPHPVGRGGLVGLHDSGGERQLLIDLADEMRVPLAKLSADTSRELESLLDPGLPAVNPLDAWGAGGEGANRVMQDCLTAMARDADCAIAAVVHDRAPYSQVYPEYFDYMRVAHAASGKPVCLVANRQGTGSSPDVVRVTREGFPVVDGLRSFLDGVRCLFGHRDFMTRPPDTIPSLDSACLERIRGHLRDGALAESGSLELLRLAGIPVIAHRIVHDWAALRLAAGELGYPVVLKTAVAGIDHKSDLDGVRLDLGDEAELEHAWRDLSGRLGTPCLVAAMAEPGLELMLGMVQDAQFGPLVAMGLGGTAVEAHRDVVFALPPFGPGTAHRRLARLRNAELLSFARGQAPPDLDAFCKAAALFSVLVAELADSLAEIDINPVIVGPGGCTAVDALVIGRTSTNRGPT